MNQLITVKDIPVFKKRVLVRVDLNVPYAEGNILDDTRMRHILPTLNLLVQNQAAVILMSHFGQARGENRPEYSLKKLVPALSHLCERPIAFVEGIEDIQNSTVLQTRVQNLASGEVLLLENLRFHPGETSNNPAFAQALAGLGDLYVNEAFSVSHRSHASIVGISAYLQSVAGLELAKEVAALTQLTRSPKRPAMAIVGGAKISSKLSILKQLVQQMEMCAIGGAMAHTFLVAQGHSVGQSLYEPDMLSVAESILNQAARSGCQILLPQDVGVSETLKTGTLRQDVLLSHIQPTHQIGDVGPKTIKVLKAALQRCKTVVWNGPLGVFEVPPFDQGTRAVAQIIGRLTQEGHLQSLAGGGETLAALNQAEVTNLLSYVSTAGGAFLAWLEGDSLPGLLSLEENFKEE